MTEKADERNKKYFPCLRSVLFFFNQEELLGSDDLEYSDITRLYGFIAGIETSGIYGDNYASSKAELRRYVETHFK